MPEFQLKTNARRSHPYYALNDFAKGYVEAMFFTNGDTGDEREDLLNELGVERLTREAVKVIAIDCADFETRARELLALAYTRDYDDVQAGRDFWFTRQGHGCGFWDRDTLKVDVFETASGDLCAREDFDGSEATGSLVGVLGELLTRVAKASGEADVEVWRGWIHYR